MIDISTALALYAKRTPGHEERVQAAVGILRRACSEHAGHVVQASSLGAEDMAISALAKTHGLDLPVAMLDTGRLHAQTLELAGRAEAFLGRPIERWLPESQSVVRFVGRHGMMAMRESVDLRKECCRIRKVEPLARMLQGRSCWVAGLRRGQSVGRSEVLDFEAGMDGRVKASPLARWSWKDVWLFISEHGVPYNELHDQFMPSIGCEPCTRAVPLGADPRSGRWWWEDEAGKECGIHAKG